MISWVQRNFQQHFRIIFGVVLVGTIVSFVATIGATSSISWGNKRTIEREFFGRNLGSSEDMNQIIHDAALSAQFMYGYSNMSDDQLKGYAFRRIAALHLADQLHIPDPTPDQLTRTIRGLRLFAGQDGRFDANRYNQFRNSLTGDSGTAGAAMVRVLTEDVRASQVGQVLSGPGYVLPGDIRRALETGDTFWTLAVASVDYASFHPSIAPTDADIQKYFAENPFRYEVPPRVVASYVGFSAADYLASVTVTDEELNSYFDANAEKFAPPADPKAKPTDRKPIADFKTARPQVELEVRLRDAQRLALDAASRFAVSLYDNKVAPGPALDAFLAEAKVKATPLAPFTREAGPAEFGGSPEISAAAFNLGPDRYFSEELTIPGGAAVILWKETLPTRKPSLIEVRPKVVADFLENERRIRFVQLGRTLRARIEAGLKSGLAFDEAAKQAAAGDVSVHTQTMAPFQLRSQPKDLDDSIRATLDGLEKGHVSEMIPGTDEGRLVYAVDKRVPNLTETNPDYAQNRAEIASYSAQLGTAAYLGEIVERELKRSEDAAK
jgi:peptidyl-prolyl cis-trans isomerase D